MRSKNGNVENLRVQVANRLAALRKEQHFTLKQLSGLTGLSETYLSRLENHKAPLSIENLASISAALEVPIEMFFSSSESQLPLILTRRGKGTLANFRGKHGYKAQLLAHGKTRKFMEPLFLTINNDNTETPLQKHGGQEFSYVIEGSCQLEYGTQKFVLEKGDSAYYDANVPHATRPLGGAPCQMLVVVASDEYSFHGNLVRLLNHD